MYTILNMYMENCEISAARNKNRIKATARSFMYIRPEIPGNLE